ncbi:hypothetical protein EDD37DRAFT_294775 [Exophiala viscosa]|uniref:Protein kinase domain-containing protein n=1 Tax=Exophiala viscosa TaxID=2486360 RepID=A0AAN6E848_9EURO|nr:hypothetical protein EDD36DRAFT_47638 [Exophiala viscosa]KAI1628137.1 hypothetical protein EDD37DRAFT_294775 [Exophiala viscosa]
MAEFLSVELMIMIAKDVFLVTRWTYNTIRTASKYDAEIAALREKFHSQLVFIRAFAQIFLSNLPANSELSWLPDLRLKFKDLQNLLDGSRRLALKHDPTYREFNESYTRALEGGTDSLQAQLPAGQDQWLIEDEAAAPTGALASSSNTLVLPTASNTKHQPSGQKKEVFKLGNWKASYKAKLTAFKFAAFEKPKLEAMLKQMQQITGDMKQGVPYMMIDQPVLSKHGTQERWWQMLDEAGKSPEFRRDAEATGALNYAGIQRIKELGEDDTTPEEHQQQLRSLPFSKDTPRQLSDVTLEPEYCTRLSAGKRKDHDGASQDVLIEYKGWSGGDRDFSAQRRKDIESLVHVLAFARPPFYPNLLSLRGYVVQEEDKRIAFVFDFPPDSLYQQPQSLNSIIESEPPMKDASSLKNRSKIALELAKSLAALHAAGWVHQSVCSESVVIFTDSESKVAYDKPYLVNFEFSRTAGGWTNHASAAATHLRRYQHPERSPDDPAKYERKHDMFSLGVVLLEIGLWKTAETMCQLMGVAVGNQILAKDAYLDLAGDELGQAMGDDYRDAVVSLLSASEGNIDKITNVIKACPKFDP